MRPAPKPEPKYEVVFAPAPENLTARARVVRFLAELEGRAK